ncbi:MAG: peptide-methionine (S)-S-oxide reductase MsrA [Gammaproteobacteria bacterium]|jgi:peptide methionine sulfoxide reductase msrA/msrB
MLNWNDIIRFANQGNPPPDRRVEKSDAQWRKDLDPDQYRVMREKGTEGAFSSDMCSLLEPGRYACAGCGTVLFEAGEKFDSGTGWPSFTQPAKENAVAYHLDSSHGMQRVETVCNTCDAHLGHVFPDGPPPSGLRYCINALALKKTAASGATATFGGGCFWCTEAIFQELAGVRSVTSGYSGGDTPDPTYEAVCRGRTGHAEVVQIEFDPAQISYADLVRIHLSTHNPTTPDRQGADRGTQYRSIILAHDDEQAAVAQQVIEEMAAAFDDPIVTEIKPLRSFHAAEAYHQDYYATNPDRPYCTAVISPKLQRFRALFGDRIRDAHGVETD